MTEGKPPVTRWTADTEKAFLRALRRTGSLTQACRAIGRSNHGAYDRRRRIPAFAAKWQAVLNAWQREAVGRATAQAAAQAAATDPGEMPNRVRHDGWTPKRQRAFLRALTATGVFEDACRAVRVSAASARRMRTKYPSFEAACTRALAKGEAGLEDAAYVRAVEGWDEPVIAGGKLVGTRRRYSDALLRLMLARAGAGKRLASEAARAATDRDSARAKAMASVAGKLDALARQAAEQARAEMLAWAEDMAARGLAP